MVPLRWSVGVALATVLNSVSAAPQLVPSQDLRKRAQPGTVQPRTALNTYDYIVVGGGTGGAAVAARLSETANMTVLLLEAGPDYDQVLGPALPTSTIFANVPGGDVLFCGSYPNDTYADIDWQFVTQPQAGASNRRIHYARGKTLGGSSVRNFMIYQRGTSQSYDQWASLTGDSGWSWTSVLPYFKKSVAFTPPKDNIRNVSTPYDPSAYSPTGGPLYVSYPNAPQEFAAWMRRGMNAIGIANQTDFNTGTLNGVNYCATTINPNTGARATSRNTFIDGAVNRSNFAVKTNTLVRYVIFSGNTSSAAGSRRAIAVQAGPANSNGTTALPAKQTFYARREIIISAGAFQSPQLLKTSGIGPAAEITRYGIPLVYDSPNVGGGMQDHIFFTPSYGVYSKPDSPNPNAINTFTRLANDAGYLLTQVGAFLAGLSGTGGQRGPLTNNVADMLGWERFSDLKLDLIGASVLKSYPKDWPTVEYLDAPGFVGNFGNLFTGQPKVPAGLQYASILGALVSPRSRGIVNITSADTNDLPTIDPKWFTDPVDVAVGVELYKRIRAAFASSAVKPVLNGTEVFPGLQVQSDAQIKKVISDTLLTVWHASCTCAMGSDKSSVLDSKLQVRGVSGLRVIDASSFPVLPPGHPQSTIYMIAERGADLIKANAASLPTNF